MGRLLAARIRLADSFFLMRRHVIGSLLIVGFVGLGLGRLPGAEVLMRNGDRLTGSIVKFDGAALTLKSELTGTLVVSWPSVSEIHAGPLLYFGLADGRVLAGSVTTWNEMLHIEALDGGLVVVPMAELRFIHDEREHKRYQRSLRGRLTDFWAGWLDFGFSQSTGNATASTISSSANATRLTPRDKITANFTSIVSRTKLDSRSVSAANALRGSLAYNVNVNHRLFVYASSDAEFDEFQSLDLRLAPAAGFGYHVKQSPQTIVDLFGGGSLNREMFATGLRRSSGEASIGDELSHKLFGGAITLRQRLVFYPNLTRSGQFRLNFDFSKATSLRKWLAWQVTVSNRFLSNPLPQRKTNDLLFTAGFRVTFTQ